jgi:hypothetical protein
MRLPCHCVSVLSQQTTTRLETNLMPFTHADNLLRCYQRCTESIVAEHHPDEPGMCYVIRIIGGKHTGIEIHCPTEASTVRLFDALVAARQDDYDHPFLAAV